MAMARWRRMRGDRLAFGLLLLLGLGGAWLVLRSTGEEQGDAPATPAARALDAVPPTGPQLEGVAHPAPSVIVEAWTAPRMTVGATSGVEILGHVIDREGRAVEGGEVWGRPRQAAGHDLARAEVRGGRFHLKLPKAGKGTVLVAYADEPRRASELRHVEVEADSRTDGVELIAELMGTLKLQVLDPSGAPAPTTRVEVLAAGARPTRVLSLDEQGRAFVRLPSGNSASVTVSAQSGDGLFRGRAGSPLGAGTTTELTLRLEGPWSPIPVRCVSRPEGSLRGERASVLIGEMVKADIEIDGPPVQALAPPARDRLRVYASARPAGEGVLDTDWGPASVDRARRGGLTVLVEQRADLHLLLVDAHGLPLPGFRVSTPTWGEVCTDSDGRGVLRHVPVGTLPFQTVLGAVGSVEVSAEGAEQRLVVPGPTSRLGGRWTGPSRAGLVQIEVEIEAGQERRFLGFADAEAGRWWASVPLAPGTEVRVCATASLQQRWSEVRDGRTGEEDLDLACIATELEIEPHLGRILRPEGQLRLQGDPSTPQARGGGGYQILPAHTPVARYGPVSPGRYRVAFSTDNGRTWIEHPEPIEVGAQPRRVVVTFEPP